MRYSTLAKGNGRGNAVEGGKAGIELLLVRRHSILAGRPGFIPSRQRKRISKRDLMMRRSVVMLDDPSSGR